MTVLTKPSLAGKTDNAETDVIVAVENGTNMDQIENENSENQLLLQSRARRMLYSLPTILLIFVTLCLVGTVILSGWKIYQRSHRQTKPMRLHGIFGIPYENEYEESKEFLRIIQQFTDLTEDSNALTSSDSMNSFLNGLNSSPNDYYFKEEMDLSDDVSNIYVPDFRDGRNGRFIHDFRNNQTAIIDGTSKRCFVMPLDRDSILPPKSFADAIRKMLSGYYDINTTSIRKNMRVRLPALDDLSSVSSEIRSGCVDMKVYRLENYISGVFK